MKLFNWGVKLPSLKHITKKELKARSKSTPFARKLSDALRNRGIPTILELWDRHKHIDVAIPDAKLNIEIDGEPHWLSAKQIEADLLRNYWSTDKGYATIHVPNYIIDKHLYKHVKAILTVIRKRIKK